MNSNAIETLLRSDAFTPQQNQPLFLAAAEECLHTLCDRFPRYAEFLRRRTKGEFPRPLTNWEELEALPPIYLPVLKAMQFDVPDSVDVSVTLTSSGTSGQPSAVPLDHENMQRRVAVMRAAYDAQNLLQGSPHAIGFLMDPATTQMAGSLVIDAVLRSHPEVQSVTYLARMGETGPQFDAERALEVLRPDDNTTPLLLVGYPALIASAIQQFRQLGQQSFPLPAGSIILTGGGWKSFLPGVNLDRDEFQSLAANFFELSRSSVRDMFGLSECPAVFVQSASGDYLVPNFAHAEAINPETGAPVPANEIGLLQLTVPLTTSYPLLKILTTDKVRMTLDPNGEAQAILHPCGRVSAARFETCAMKIGRAVA